MKKNKNTNSKLKKNCGKIFTIAACLLSLSFISSCEKDEGKLPNISFKVGPGYTSGNGSIAKNTAFVIGIDASKAEDKDVLKTCDISLSADGGVENSVFSENLSGSSNENTYSKDVTFTTRNQTGTEKYTCTVINRDGLKNSVALTLTVN